MRNPITVQKYLPYHLFDSSFPLSRPPRRAWVTVGGVTLATAKLFWFLIEFCVFVLPFFGHIIFKMSGNKSEKKVGRTAWYWLVFWFPLKRGEEGSLTAEKTAKIPAKFRTEGAIKELEWEYEGGRKQKHRVKIIKKGGESSSKLIIQRPTRGWGSTVGGTFAPSAAPSLF